MTLPLSGPISLLEVNEELGFPPTDPINMNSSDVRLLFEVPISGSPISMSDGYGKSSTRFTLVVSSNTTNLNVRSAAVAAGWDEDLKVLVIVAPGVYVWSGSVASPAMTISGSFPNGVEVLNQGYIMGCGGNGAWGKASGTTGGTAISIGVNVTINNTNASAYIGGGGGGGGGIYGQIRSSSFSNPALFAFGGGGGGAGGGIGGGRGTAAPSTSSTLSGTQGGGSGAGPGGTGGNQSNYFYSLSNVVTVSTALGARGGTAGGGGGQAGAPFSTFNIWGGGGGGGRVFPGTTAAGSLSRTDDVTVVGGIGWGLNVSGGTGLSSGTYGQGAGGGGGWGAVGGSAGNTTYGATGGPGGKAVALNGYSVTWTSGDTARVYGSVS
jgi:hypothetical protein